MRSIAFIFLMFAVSGLTHAQAREFTCTAISSEDYANEAVQAFDRELEEYFCPIFENLYGHEKTSILAMNGLNELRIYTTAKLPIDFADRDHFSSKICDNLDNIHGNKYSTYRIFF